MTQILGILSMWEMSIHLKIVGGEIAKLLKNTNLHLLFLCKLPSFLVFLRFMRLKWVRGDDFHFHQARKIHFHHSNLLPF